MEYSKKLTAHYIYSNPPTSHFQCNHWQASKKQTSEYHYYQWPLPDFGLSHWEHRHLYSIWTRSIPLSTRRHFSFSHGCNILVKSYRRLTSTNLYKILILYRLMIVRCAVSVILAHNTGLCKKLSELRRGTLEKNSNFRHTKKNCEGNVFCSSSLYTFFVDRLPTSKKLRSTTLVY